MARTQYGDQNGRNGSKAQDDKRARIQAMRQSKGEQPDWARIRVELLGAFVAATTKDDGAVRFGYSRDGGAYCIALYMGGSPDTVYFHTDEEIEEYMNQVWEALHG